MTDRIKIIRRIVDGLYIQLMNGCTTGYQIQMTTSDGLSGRFHTNRLTISKYNDSYEITLRDYRSNDSNTVLDLNKGYFDMGMFLIPESEEDAFQKSVIHEYVLPYDLAVKIRQTIKQYHLYLSDALELHKGTI